MTAAAKLGEAARSGRLLVKICGMRTLEDARFAVEQGADALGFVFWYMSPRRLEPEQAALISAELPASVLRVGVFVDAPREEIERTADSVGLDLLQLHGEEPPEALVGLSRPALKAVRVGPKFTAEEALRYSDVAAGIVVDTRLPGETSMPGGTGVPFDWSYTGPLIAIVAGAVIVGEILVAWCLRQRRQTPPAEAAGPQELRRAA